MKSEAGAGELQQYGSTAAAAAMAAAAAAELMMQPPLRSGMGQAARSGQGPSGGAARAGPGAARKHLNTKVLSGVLRQVKNNVPKTYLAPFLVSMYAVGVAWVPQPPSGLWKQLC